MLASSSVPPIALTIGRTANPVIVLFKNEDAPVTPPKAFSEPDLRERNASRIGLFFSSLGGSNGGCSVEETCEDTFADTPPTSETSFFF